jgi:hypothetical protein
MIRDVFITVYTVPYEHLGAEQLEQSIVMKSG